MRANTVASTLKHFFRLSKPNKGMITRGTRVKVHKKETKKIQNRV